MKKIKVALNKLSFLDGDILEIPFDTFITGTDSMDYYAEITDESEVYLRIGDDDTPLTLVRHIIDTSDKLDESRINDEQSYAKSSNEAFFLLNNFDYRTILLLENLEGSQNTAIKKVDGGNEFWSNRTDIGGATYTTSLFKGLCIYHILVQQSGNYNKYLPSFCDNDVFVYVSCEFE